MYNLETNFLKNRPDLKKPSLPERITARGEELSAKVGPKLERFGNQVGGKIEYISRRLPEKFANGKEALTRAYKVGKATDLTRRGWGQEIPKVVGEMWDVAKDLTKALPGEKAFRNGDGVSYLSKAEKVETSISENGRQSILSALGLLNTNNLDNKSEIPLDTLSLKNLEEICFQLRIDWIPNQMKEAIIQATREVNAEFASRNGVDYQGGNRMSSRDIASKLLMGALDKYVNNGGAILEARSSKFTEDEHVEALERGRKYGHLINRAGGSKINRDKASSAGLSQEITVRSVVASWQGIVSNNPDYSSDDLRGREKNNADRPRSIPQAVELKPLTPEELAELARIKTENLKTLNELMLGAGAKGGQGVLELAQIEDDSDFGTQNLTYLDQDSLDNKLSRLSDSQITQEELKEIVSQLPTKADLYSALKRFENLVQTDAISNQEVISWFVEAVNNRKGVEAKDVPIPESDLEPLPRSGDKFELEGAKFQVVEGPKQSPELAQEKFDGFLADFERLKGADDSTLIQSAVMTKKADGIFNALCKPVLMTMIEESLEKWSNNDIYLLLKYYKFNKQEDPEKYQNFITNFVEILEGLKVKQSREVMSPPDQIFAGNGANITVTESLHTGNPEEESQETQNNQKLNVEINRYLLDVGEKGGAFGVSNLVRELQSKNFGDTPDLVTLNKLKNIISSLQAGGDKIAENLHLAKLQPVYNSIKTQFDSLTWNANSNQIKPVAEELQRLLADLQTKINLPQVPSAPIFTPETPVLIPEPQITEVPFVVVPEVETPIIVPQITSNDSNRPPTVIEPSISTVETKVTQDKRVQLNLLNDLLKAGSKDSDAVDQLLKDEKLISFLKDSYMPDPQKADLAELLAEIEKNPDYSNLVANNLDQFNQLKQLVGIGLEVAPEVVEATSSSIEPEVTIEDTFVPDDETKGRSDVLETDDLGEIIDGEVILKESTIQNQSLNIKDDILDSKTREKIAPGKTIDDWYPSYSLTDEQIRLLTKNDYKSFVTDLDKVLSEINNNPANRKKAIKNLFENYKFELLASDEGSKKEKNYVKDNDLLDNLAYILELIDTDQNFKFVRDEIEAYQEYNDRYNYLSRLSGYSKSLDEDYIQNLYDELNPSETISETLKPEKPILKNQNSQTIQPIIPKVAETEVVDTTSKASEIPNSEVFQSSLQNRIIKNMKKLGLGNDSNELVLDIDGGKKIRLKLEIRDLGWFLSFQDPNNAFDTGKQLGCSSDGQFYSNFKDEGAIKVEDISNEEASEQVDTVFNYLNDFNKNNVSDSTATHVNESVIDISALTVYESNEDTQETSDQRLGRLSAEAKSYFDNTLNVDGVEYEGFHDLNQDIKAVINSDQTYEDAIQAKKLQPLLENLQVLLNLMIDSGDSEFQDTAHSASVQLDSYYMAVKDNESENQQIVYLSRAIDLLYKGLSDLEKKY